jgi:molybdopterin biosynthesis enzyme
MIVAIGGTGSGRNDESVRTLARAGTVQFHGIGITPGETTALGFVGARPVLLLPGRIDAALAGWLTCRPAHAGAPRLPPDRGAAVRRRAGPQDRFAARACRSHRGAAAARQGRAGCAGILSMQALGSRRRLDPGAGRQRGLRALARASW